MNDLWHATFASTIESINEKGLLPGPDGCVYLAGPTFAHAAQFLQFRQDIERYDEVNHGGSQFRVPVPYENQIVYGLQIIRGLLNPALLHPSGDHNPEFFEENTDSYYYDGLIETGDVPADDAVEHEGRLDRLSHPGGRLGTWPEASSTQRE